MRYLSVGEVLEIHRQVVANTASLPGVHSLAALESAVAQPHMTFDGQELYPSLPEKAAALGFSLIQNHPFLDGNKRTGHAALEVFLVLNGHELNAPVDEQYALVMSIAMGETDRAALLTWLEAHIVPVP